VLERVPGLAWAVGAPPGRYTVCLRL
jgi:hypothetical protein